jgi:hypothetical protein
MASMYSPVPIRPFRQPEGTDERPEQALYTISKEDQERLAPYLPPKRSDFLRERPDSPLPETSIRRYHIMPHFDQPWEVLNAFSERLKKETEPNTLFIVDNPEFKILQMWRQNLTPEQVIVYRKDPAVYWHCLETVRSFLTKQKVASIFIDDRRAHLDNVDSSESDVDNERPKTTENASEAQCNVRAQQGLILKILTFIGKRISPSCNTHLRTIS